MPTSICPIPQNVQHQSGPEGTCGLRGTTSQDRFISWDKCPVWRVREAVRGGSGGGRGPPGTPAPPLQIFSNPKLFLKSNFLMENKLTTTTKTSQQAFPENTHTTRKATPARLCCAPKSGSRAPKHPGLRPTAAQSSGPQLAESFTFTAQKILGIFSLEKSH